MIMISVYIVIVVLTVVNLLEDYRRDLMMMQQNSYRPERYRKWLSQSGDASSVMRLCGYCVFFIAVVRFANCWFGIPLGVFALVSFLKLHYRKYKKPLVWTRRAIRIYSVMCLVSAIVLAVVLLLVGGNLFDHLYYTAFALTGLYCGSHIVTLLAVWLLKPVEKSINRGYYNEAASILKSVHGLKVIGITGSYGKTSTKHYLNRILSEEYEVLMTPGSYNTTMGVIRTVREMMKPYTEIFICEMGAKNVGDIKEICDLVHPEMAIVTAVGPMHLESFGSIENVQRTKFELVDSLSTDGFAVINDDFEYCANRPVKGPEVVRYGIQASDVDFAATDIVYSPTGTSFTIRKKSDPDFRLDLTTPLVGECNISNLLAAIVMALHLDVPKEKIAAAVARIEQVEHRLNMKRTPGGVNIIDDAFNSNPVGSAMALNVLKAMTGRRIVVTPGMIELGEKQFDLNKEFGRNIAQSADIAIVVGEYNREAIVEGIMSDEAFDQSNLHIVATFADAQALLGTILRPGDTILYENDLPDTFK